MKTLKKISGTVIILCLSAALIFAQESSKEELTIPLTNPGQPGKLECSLVNGSITVTGYSGNEIHVVATQPVKKITVEDAGFEPDVQGMKKISASSFNLSAEEEDNIVEIGSSSWKSAINLEIQVPQKFSLDVGTVNQGNITIQNVDGTLEVSNVNGSITLTNVSGSVVTNTVNGKILVDLVRVDTDTPMSFASFNGDVDVTLPGSVKATAKMKSTSGDIYTDFEVEFERKKSKVDESDEEGVYKVTIDEYVYGNLNGGGPEFVFKNYHGNIYLRKK
ncbi:MAG: DUF4097 family beta strand repeat protein [Bacteroidales bacterium]|nr:MAG: DUF4097 family beta strand repeat protein [Bacteroidales bacterium]